MKKILLILLLPLMLNSCTTTLRTEPNEVIDSLVIGQISLNAKNFQYHGDATVNGQHTSKIELTFMNITSGEKINVKSQGSTGLFYFTNLSNSRYQLTRVDFKDIGSNESWAHIYITPNNLVFDITADKVFNLGQLSWIANKKTESYRVIQNNKFDETRNIIFDKYPESNWNAFNWENTSF